MPLNLKGCIPHTSFLGFFLALFSTSVPYLGEIVYLFYAFNETTYIDQHTVVPSFWFRRWRPGFLIAGILYDVAMLGYCIYTEDIFVVLLVVRILMESYQLYDQMWLIKNWIPFFVDKEKRPYLFLRMFLLDCIWNLLVGVEFWSGSWQKPNEVFTNIFYLMFFVLTCATGLWYVIQGGVNALFKYRFHWMRNSFVWLAGFCMILGIVGLSIGDGGGNNLVDTLDYHSAFVLVYCGINCQTAAIMHQFIVIYEEIAWKQRKLIPVYEDEISPEPSSFPRNEATMTTTKPINNSDSTSVLVGSNKVTCDEDIPIEIASAIDVHQRSNLQFLGERSTAEDAKKEDGDMEIDYDMEATGDSFYHHTSAKVTARAPSMVLSQIMRMKLKRHELVLRGIDELFAVGYQMFLWEVVMWLAQIFLGLYLESNHYPYPEGQNDYYCHSPLERVINSVQFANDAVFARK